jgi:hypothetical protein
MSHSKIGANAEDPYWLSDNEVTDENYYLMKQLIGHRFYCPFSFDDWADSVFTNTIEAHNNIQLIDVYMVPHHFDLETEKFRNKNQFDEMYKNTGSTYSPVMVFADVTSPKKQVKIHRASLNRLLHIYMTDILAHPVYNNLNVAVWNNTELLYIHPSEINRQPLVAVNEEDVVVDEEDSFTFDPIQVEQVTINECVVCPVNKTHKLHTAIINLMVTDCIKNNSMLVCPYCKSKNIITDMTTKKQEMSIYLLLTNENKEKTTALENSLVKKLLSKVGKTNKDEVMQFLLQ